MAKKRNYTKVPNTIKGLRVGMTIYFGAYTNNHGVDERPKDFDDLLDGDDWAPYKIVKATALMWKLEEVWVNGKSLRWPYANTMKLHTTSILKTAVCTNTNGTVYSREWFYSKEEYENHKRRCDIVKLIKSDQVTDDQVCAIHQRIGEELSASDYRPPIKEV